MDQGVLAGTVGRNEAARGEFQRAAAAQALLAESVFERAQRFGDVLGKAKQSQITEPHRGVASWVRVGRTQIYAEDANSEWSSGIPRSGSVRVDPRQRSSFVGASP